MIPVFYQIAIFILIFVGIFILSKIIGIFIHEDWFYSGKILKEYFRNVIDVLMKFRFSSVYRLDINMLQMPFSISGKDLISKEFSLEAECTAKQMSGEYKEGELEFYFTRPIDCEKPHIGVQKTILENLYAKFRAVAYGLKTCTSYRWDSESLLPFSFYETCLTFKGIKKNMISDTPSVNIELSHTLNSLDAIKFLIKINPLKPVPEKYVSRIKMFVNRSSFPMKSEEYPVIKKFGQEYRSEFLFKIPNKLTESDFIEFNLEFTNEDNLLRNVELKAITGTGPLPQRKSFTNYECNYNIKICITDYLIKNLLKNDLLFGVTDIEAKAMSASIARKFATENEIKIRNASVCLRNYFVSIQDLCPLFLKRSIFKIIEGFNIMEQVPTQEESIKINDELMQAFIIKDAFDKANTLLMEQSLLKSKK